MILSHSYCSRAGSDARIVVCPVLSDKGFRIELHHESTIQPFTKQARCIDVKDKTIGREIIHHGGARIEEESRADRKIYEGLQHDDVALRLAIVEYPQIVLCQVRKRGATGIKCVEGKADFVDRNSQSVGRCIV